MNKPLRELALNIAAPLLGYRLGAQVRGSKRAVTCPDGQVLELSLGELWDHLREHHGADLDAPPVCCDAGCTSLDEMLKRHGTADASTSARHRLLLAIAT